MKQYKIYISPSNQTANSYATGKTNEQVQCHKIAEHCVNKLKKCGMKNVKCTYNMDMYQRVSEGNSYGADIYVCIHTNATVKHNVTGGTQILLYKLEGENKVLGQKVLDKLGAITPGKSAEKLIAKPGFYEIRNSNGICVYCECEFHDTKEGSDFIIKNTKAIGEAIADAILEYAGYVAPKEEIKAPSKSDKELYRVQVGAFSVKKNATALQKQLKEDGYEAIIVKY